MSQSFLLTRSKTANATLKAKLAYAGGKVFECNLIDYELALFDESVLDEYTDLVITSPFAAKKVPINLDNTCYAWVVGEYSRDILRNKGYKIRCCAPNATELKKELQSLWPSILSKASRVALRDGVENSNSGALIVYLSSNNITLEMPVFVKRKVFYNVLYKKSLSEAEIKRFKHGIDYILLYSENCAKTLLQLLLENDLLKYLEKTTIVAISSKVGNVLEGYVKNIKICDSSEGIIGFSEKKLIKSKQHDVLRLILAIGFLIVVKYYDLVDRLMEIF